MKSFQIRKWQDNYAEDCAKEKNKDENLVNATLELANQVAELNENRECWIDTSIFVELNRTLMQFKSNLISIISAKKHYPDMEKYTIKVFKWFLPIVVYKENIR